MTFPSCGCSAPNGYAVQVYVNGSLSGADAGTYALPQGDISATDGTDSLYIWDYWGTYGVSGDSVSFTEGVWDGNYDDLSSVSYSAPSNTVIVDQVVLADGSTCTTLCAVYDGGGQVSMSWPVDSGFGEYDEYLVQTFVNGVPDCCFAQEGSATATWATQTQLQPGDSVYFQIAICPYYDPPTSGPCSPGDYPWGPSSNTAVVPGGNQLMVKSDRTTVWGNGHDKTTVTVTAHGDSIAGKKIDLAASPSTGVTIKPAMKGSDKADGSGQATFTVTSVAPIDPNDPAPAVTLTASTADSSDDAPGSTTVTFVRHKVVIQLLGITTSLDCKSDGTCHDNPKDPSDVFLPLRTDEESIYGFQPTDFLWYSYKGGGVDKKTGNWDANSYSCANTAQSYVTDINDLQKMISDYTTDNPNTDLYLVGHSQGGLIAYQQLASNSDLSSTAQLADLITLDSPLGGVPYLGTLAASSFGSCWKGKAPTQLADYWSAGGQSDFEPTNAGDLNELLCSYLATSVGDLGGCPDYLGTFNAAMASEAEHAGTGVYTYGSSDDAVYTPSSCSLSSAFTVPTTQIVSTATGSGIYPLGNDIGILSTCVHNSHVAIVPYEQSNIEGIIGSQIADS